MLTILGIIAVFFILKFVYDTYVTGWTQKNMEDTRKYNPEEAARLAINKGLNLNTSYKYNANDINTSLEIIALRMMCEKDEVKEKFIEISLASLTTESEIDSFIKQLRQQKYNESISLKFDPDNTPAGLMHKWIEENRQEFRYRREAVKLFETAQKNQSKSGRDWKETALERIEETNFDGALRALENSFSKSDIKDHPSIYLVQASCYFQMGEFDNAIAAADNGLNLMTTFQSGDFELLDKLQNLKKESLTEKEANTDSEDNYYDVR